MLNQAVVVGELVGNAILDLHPAAGYDARRFAARRALRGFRERPMRAVPARGGWS